jgi:hypothetical protein
MVSITWKQMRIEYHVAISYIRAPAQVADRGRLARYGGYRGNKIPGADQNQPLLPCSV